jgi:hypothetical protein
MGTTGPAEDDRIIPRAAVVRIVYAPRSAVRPPFRRRHRRVICSCATRVLAETLHQIHVNRVAIEMKVQRAVADWRGLLSGSVEDGRQLLREVLESTAEIRA